MQRTVLVLWSYDDRSVQEIAALLECSESAVKTHTQRALAGSAPPARWQVWKGTTDDAPCSFGDHAPRRRGPDRPRAGADRGHRPPRLPPHPPDPHRRCVGGMVAIIAVAAVSLWAAKWPGAFLGPAGPQPVKPNQRVINALTDWARTEP